MLKIYRVYHNNTTGADTENVVFSVGFGRAIANTIGAKYGDIEKDLSVGGSVDATSYKLNGSTVAFPEKKTIGYVVYCTGGSNNKAGCFIPSGVSGAFQCASNDWYCAFNFDGSGNATKTGGTGSVASVSEVKNF